MPRSIYILANIEQCCHYAHSQLLNYILYSYKTQKFKQPPRSGVSTYQDTHWVKVDGHKRGMYQNVARYRMICLVLILLHK